MTDSTGEIAPVALPEPGQPGKPAREREGGRLVLIVVVLLALLLAGGYVAAYAAAGDKVPRGTTVAGVAIGGRTPAQAQQALEAGLADRVDQLVLVAVGSESREIAPSELGLSVDYAASVSEAGGERTWDPQRLWNYYTGGEDLDPVVELDEATLEQRPGRPRRGVRSPRPRTARSPSTPDERS